MRKVIGIILVSVFAAVILTGILAIADWDALVALEAVGFSVATTSCLVGGIYLITSSPSKPKQ